MRKYDFSNPIRSMDSFVPPVKKFQFLVLWFCKMLSLVRNH